MLPSSCPSSHCNSWASTATVVAQTATTHEMSKWVEGWFSFCFVFKRWSLIIVSVICEISRYLCWQYHKELGMDIGLETEAMSTRYVIWFITYGWCVWYRNIKIQGQFENEQDKKINPADSRPLLPFNKYFLDTSSEPGAQAGTEDTAKKERKKTRVLLEFTFRVFISYTHPTVYETISL